MTKSKGQVQVEFLRDLISQGGRIVKANFSLQRGLLENVEPKYYLTLEQNKMRSLQELSWTPEIEEFLLFDQQRSVETEDEEAERFASILSNNLKDAEHRFGKDYSQAVFVQILRERPQYPLSDSLKRVPTYPPGRDSHSYGPCTAALTRSIDGLHNTAIMTLGYDKDTAAILMTRALSIVLDEAFYISAREKLFPTQ